MNFEEFDGTNREGEPERDQAPDTGANPDIGQISTPDASPENLGSPGVIPSKKVFELSWKTRLALVIALASLAGIGISVYRNSRNSGLNLNSIPTPISDPILTPNQDSDPNPPIVNPTPKNPDPDSEPLDPLSYTKAKFGDVPHLDDAKITSAFLAIESAIAEIRANPSIMEHLKKHGIVLHEPEYYMAIAIKESFLNPAKTSRSGMVGLFQLSTGKKGALGDLERVYGVNYEEDDVFYTGKNSKKIQETSRNNAQSGILYWHLCKDIYLSKGFSPEILAGDRDNATAFAYNMGIGDFRNLWNTIGKDSFDKFVEELARLVEADYGNFITARTEVIHDDVYGVDYTQYLSLQKDIKSSAQIKIGGRTYRILKILESLRYTKVVESLMDLEIDEKIPQTPTEETMRSDYKMWSLSNNLLKRCIEDYQMPCFMTPGLTRTQKLEILYGVIIDYNIQTNAQFRLIFMDADRSSPDIPDGVIVRIPPREFIVRQTENLNQDSSTPQISGTDLDRKFPTPTRMGNTETLPSGVPMYTGSNAIDLERQGRMILAYNGNFPFKIVVPKNRKGKTINTSRPNNHPPLKNPTHIILHSTEGSGSGLYKTQNIHYLVRPDGTVEQIRDEDIGLDHAGRMQNVTRKAMWNGDGEISLHSIGIEVETTPGGTYNDAQYLALKHLIHWIGQRHSIPAAHVLGHSQIAASNWGRGRKQDPRRLDFTKLGLPNNYLRIDPDVASGILGSNLRSIFQERAHSQDGWGLNTSTAMIAGLRAAEAICKRNQNCAQ